MRAKRISSDERPFLVTSFYSSIPLQKPRAFHILILHVSLFNIAVTAAEVCLLS